MDTEKQSHPILSGESRNIYHIGYMVLFYVKPKDSSRKIQGQKWSHIEAAQSLRQDKWAKEETTSLSVKGFYFIIFYLFIHTGDLNKHFLHARQVLIP